ncbi:hypothetical protein EAI30_08595 [Romboutsia ilealis]|nr:hypothetical protein [Romboutsia ilealis]
MIVVIITILLGGAYFMLLPSEKVTLDTNNKIITIEDLLKDNFIESFEILNNPIRLKGILEISQEEFRDILYTVITKYNIEEFKRNETTLHDDFIKIKAPYRILNFIDTQYEVNIYPSIIGNNLHLKLKDVKIGKLKLPNSIVSAVLKSNMNTLPFEIEKNEIIVGSSYIEPLKIETIEVIKDKVILNIFVTATDIIEFIGEYNTK